MHIGINCFIDITICSMIESLGRSGDCEITGEKNILVYDTDINKDLGDHISEILSIYTPESEIQGDFPAERFDYIENILIENWSLFKASKIQVKSIVMELCKEMYAESALIFKEKVGMEKTCDLEYLKNNSLVKEHSWENFTGSIKNNNRFHSKHINLDLLKELFMNEGLELEIPKSGGIHFYRARICNDKGLTKDQMGPPPEKKATAGRANSAGISCLYLANDEVTTFHEIRARVLDYIAVATFTPNNDLKIVNLSNLDSISPFSEGNLNYEWFAINMTILKKMSFEIAKPLRLQDSELDYLPAQYISDFIKSLGFHGVCYRSTLNAEGLNYAFFDHQNFDCVDVKLRHIKSLEYDVSDN